jgi:hypothetical protein
MLILESVADVLARGADPDLMLGSQMADGQMQHLETSGLTVRPLRGRLGDFEFVSGLFALEDTLAQLAENHPMKIFWNSFERCFRVDPTRHS